MKIRSIHRHFSEAIPMDSSWEERILYLQDNMRRQEDRRKRTEHLWRPSGPKVTFIEGGTALIEKCDGDRKERFLLDLVGKTYAPSMESKLTPEQIAAFNERIPRFEMPREPTVRHKYVTTDTGERKEIFGYTARHVVTTYNIIPLTQEDVFSSETVTDGWYIDLDTRLPCDYRYEIPKEGTSYMGTQKVATSVGPNQSLRNVSASKPDLVEQIHAGKPETGFAIRVKTVHRFSSISANHLGEQTRTSESEVVELSSRPLDPALFEIPSNFRRVDRVRPRLCLPFWARWLAWAHRKWVELFGLNPKSGGIN